MNDLLVVIAFALLVSAAVGTFLIVWKESQR